MHPSYGVWCQCFGIGVIRKIRHQQSKVRSGLPHGFTKPSGAVIPGLPVRWNHRFDRAHRARPKRCEQHVLIVRLRIMGLHRGWLSRQPFPLRVGWHHILPGFLVTVVHIYAHLARFRLPLFDNGAHGPFGVCGPRCRVSPGPPIHVVRFGCVQTTTAFGYAWDG